MSATACRYIDADAAVGITPQWPDIRPGEARPIGHDVSKDADCQGDGVTIVSATWSVDPDASGLTLSAETEIGLVATALATASPSITEDTTFRVNVSLTLSDGQVLERPALQVVSPWA